MPSYTRRMLYNISIGAKYFYFVNEYVLRAIAYIECISVMQMEMLISNFSGKVIIIHL